LGVTTRPDDSSGVVLCRASDSALLSVDSTGAFATILSADQVDALAIQVRGWSNGNLYVETTDEHIVITLDGQENGYWASTYPFSEATIGGRLYTVWFNEDTRVYTLTSDGVRPGY
jgi:hypothetical protein